MPSKKPPLDLKLLEKARAEAKKRGIKLPEAKKPIPNLLDPEVSFEAQTKFITDPCRWKTALCPRRSGKSYTIGIYAFHTALTKPNARILYLALTGHQARKIFWTDIAGPLLAKFDIGVNFSENRQALEFENGSIIYIFGGDTAEKDRNSLLGGKYDLIIIDEAQDFKFSLKELFDGLKPTLTDTLGTCVLIGTPGNQTWDMFYDVTTKSTEIVELDGKRHEHLKYPGWSNHTWTPVDNPHMRDNFLSEIAAEKKANPFIELSPTFQQHRLGKWVVETSSLVYRFEPLNLINELPTNGYMYILGIDLGWNDATAFVVLAYAHYDPTIYIVETFKASSLDFTATANIIKDKFQKQYNLVYYVVDGANKQGVEEMKARHQLPLNSAEKQGKYEAIMMMNSDFVARNIRILNHPATLPLRDEYSKLIWAKQTNQSENPKEHPDCKNHLCDAALYAYRSAQRYVSRTRIPPQSNTNYYSDMEED